MTVRSWLIRGSSGPMLTVPLIYAYLFVVVYHTISI